MTTTRTSAIHAALATRRGDDPTLTGTNAHTRHCATCGRTVIAGYDAPLMAGLAITDPYRATWRDEAAAVILARPTWQLAGPWPTRGELINRHWPGLHPIATRRPADQVTVLIAHHCGTPPIATQPLPVTTPHGAGYPDTPPF